MTGRDVQAIVAAFTERFLDDRERGQILPLADYQARFPGYADAIAAEFAVLTGAADAVNPPAEPAERYEDRGPLGRGGMGEVRRVFDREIRREVARKTLRRDREAVAPPHELVRFLEEAQITGQLEHPGIIPIYDLGTDEDDRAFFTMSLVRGREFGEVIECVHAGRDGWTMTRALDVLLRVCDAVAFAHSKGVAHRDLKPANVLVGEFGRTHVVDWGLARVLGQPTAGDPVTSLRETLRDDEVPAALTLRGDVLGTPSYMSPEQAAGDIDRVGFASDAYALGAILYELLTGRAPYCDGESSTSAEVLAELREGPPTPVQSIRSQAPPELVAICEKAMARAPEDRYASVSDFADDVRAFTDARVVRAYQTGPLAELRKWVARNRAFAAACAAAVLALIAGMVLTLIEKRRADAAAARAEANFRTAFDAIEELSDAGWTGLENVAGLDADRRRVLERAVAFYQQFIDRRSDDPLVREHLAEASRRLGLLHGLLGQTDREIAELENASRLYEQLMADEPVSSVRSEHAWVMCDLGTVAAREGRIDDARRLLGDAIDAFEALSARQPDEIELRRRHAEALAELANAEVNHGELERAFEPRAKSVSEWEHVAKATGELRDRHHHAEAMWNLGYTEMKAGRTDAALTALAAARADLEHVLAERPDSRSALGTLAYALNGLSSLHANRGEAELSASLARECIEIRRELVRKYPQPASYHTELAGNLHNLAMVHQRSGRMHEALALFVEARREQETALATAPTSAIAQRYLSYHLNALCQVLLALGRHREAIEAAEALGPNPKGGVPQRMAPSYAARCIPIVASDPALSESEKAAIVEDYTRRSIALVRGAIEHGWTDLDTFRNAPFLGFAGRPDFDAILDR